MPFLLTNAKLMHLLNNLQHWIVIKNYWIFHNLNNNIIDNNNNNNTIDDINTAGNGALAKEQNFHKTADFVIFINIKL